VCDVVDEVCVDVYVDGLVDVLELLLLWEIL